MSADVESEVSAVLSKDMENIAAKVTAGKGNFQRLGA